MRNISKKVAIEGLLVGLSVWIGIFEHQLSSSVVQVFQGFGIIPILMIQDLFGLGSGVWCLFSYCLIRTIFFSRASFLGFLMKISVVFYMLFRKKNSDKLYKIIAFDLMGTFIAILAKIPISYMFWKGILGINSVQTMHIITKYMIPMNLIRMMIAIFISRIIKVEKYYKKLDS